MIVAEEASSLRTLVRRLRGLGAASIVVKPLWFVFFSVVCVRVLGLHEYGAMIAAFSLGGLTVGLAALGTSALVARNVAREPENAEALVQNVLPLRLVLYGVALAIVMGCTAVGLLDGRFALAFGGWAYWAAFGILELIRSLFRGLERLHWEATSVVIEKPLTVVAGTCALWLHPSGTTVLLAMAVGVALTTVGAAASLRRLNLRLRLARPSRLFMRQLLRDALPLWLATAFVLVYTRTDALMLETLRGPFETGLFAVALRMPEALVQFPDLVIAGLLPRLSRLHADGNSLGFRRLLLQSLLLVGCISVVMAVVLSVFAAPILHLIDPAPTIAAATPSLQLIAWAFPFSSTAYLISISLFVLGHQRSVTITMGIGAVMNIALNAVLIPRFGSVGACMASLVTQVFVWIAFVLLNARTQPNP